MDKVTPRGFSPSSLEDVLGGQKEASFQLLADDKWKARAEYQYLFSDVSHFEERNVSVSVIVYTDSATSVMPVYQDTPAKVRAKWGQLVGIAKSYKYAEQSWPGSGPIGFWGAFAHWPDSNYAALGSNSNTFALYALAQAGLPTREMSLYHPGDPYPHLNKPTSWSLRVGAVWFNASDKPTRR
jgi:hypothetical protein